MSTPQYVFPCGCKFPIVGDVVPGTVPNIDIDPEKIPRDCPAVWALLAKGLTKGVFQLESGLGRQWTKRLKPESAEDMSALGSILRPGCLRAIDSEGISTTQHFCRRKNREEEVKQYHPAIDPILAPTYGVLVYQEQAMQIAVAVSAFNDKEADGLRKAIGKKLPEDMSKCKTMFLEGATKAGVITKEMAEELFGWIQESQRYSFNKCLSGRETIRQGRDGHVHSVIGTIYTWKSNPTDAKGVYVPDYPNYGHGFSLTNNARVVQNIVRNIIPAGKRMVFKITLENGAEVLATDNHKFPTTHGMMTVAEMAVASPPATLFVVKDGCPSTPDTSSVKSILADQIEDTYDVEMDGPNHTVVVGSGIVACNSHSYCYAETGYDCAYAKAHIPVSFFVSALTQAKNKQDPQEEIFELVNDARLFDILVEPPDLRDLELNFQSIDRKNIKFGLADIKGIGPAQTEKMLGAIRACETKIGKPIKDWSWEEFLVYCSASMSAAVVDRLIKVGALRHLPLTRQKMLAEFAAWASLTDREQEWAAAIASVNTGRLKAENLVAEPELQAVADPVAWEALTEKEQAKELKKVEKKAAERLEKIRVIENNAAGNLDNLPNILRVIAISKQEGGIGIATKARQGIINSLADTLITPLSSMVDSPIWVSWVEEDLLGIPLSCSKIDSCDLSQVNTTCKEVLAGRDGFIMLGVEIQRVREVKTKKGKTPGAKMAFMTIADSTCQLDDVVCFPDVWKDCKSLLSEGELTIMQVERSNQGEGCIVKRAWRATQAM